jgi:hypothetical protein
MSQGNCCRGKSRNTVTVSPSNRFLVTKQTGSPAESSNRIWGDTANSLNVMFRRYGISNSRFRIGQIVCMATDRSWAIRALPDRGNPSLRFEYRFKSPIGSIDTAECTVQNARLA